MSHEEHLQQIHRVNTDERYPESLRAWMLKEYQKQCDTCKSELVGQ